MSYGIEVKNENGEVIIDDTFQSYLLSDTTTLSGTAAGNNLFFYAIGGGVQLPAFVEMEVGDFLGAGGNSFFSFKSSLTFRTGKPANEFSDPTGYGAVAYNAAGEKTWFANAAVVTVTNYAVLGDPFSSISGVFNTDSNFAAVLSRLPFHFEQAPGIFFCPASAADKIPRSQAKTAHFRPGGAGPPARLGSDRAPLLPPVLAGGRARRAGAHAPSSPPGTPKGD
jgi:hypothetical protein